MSADAKIWQDENDHWCAVHDGECKGEHRGTAYDLTLVIKEVNACMAPCPITRWLMHVYPDGQAGLRGYTY